MLASQTLFLFRGLPGSGKSTQARELLSSLQDSGIKAVHVETDMYFMDGNRYEFNPFEVPEAHSWCQDRARKSLTEGCTVIVSNTFTQMWEMKPYLEMAKSLNVEVKVIECTGNYGNVHNVPDKTIEKMRARWEEYK
jgi:predicted kinase